MTYRKPTLTAIEARTETASCHPRPPAHDCNFIDVGPVCIDAYYLR